MRNKIILAVLSTSLSSCSLYTTFKTPKLQNKNLVGSDIPTHDSVSTIPAWKAFFVDAHLQVLIEKALVSNADLQIAQQKVVQSEALLMSSKLAYLPSFMFSPEGNLSSIDHSKASYGYNLPLATQWEIDLSGKLRNNKEQVKSGLLRSKAYQKLIQTQLISALANNYYTLIMLDQQLQITQECVENQKQNLEVIIALKEAGLQTEAAVSQASANYFGVQASAKDLQKQIRILENSISLLLNEPPQSIMRSRFSLQPVFDIDINKGISLEALSNRPDVKQAEYILSEKFYGVNIAHSAFYPSITLGGTAGWTNNMSSMIANPGKLLLSAIGSITQPLFNKGVNVANLKIANAEYEQALLSFHKTLLNSGIEVNDALISCQNSTEKIQLRQKQVEANQNALSSSTELMKNSSTTYLDVLYAENTFLQSRLVQVSDWLEGIQGQISLYKAIGGGVN